jgi:hypothetical protein
MVTDEDRNAQLIIRFLVTSSSWESQKCGLQVSLRLLVKGRVYGAIFIRSAYSMEA